MVDTVWSSILTWKSWKEQLFNGKTICKRQRKLRAKVNIQCFFPTHTVNLTIFNALGRFVSNIQILLGEKKNNWKVNRQMTASLKALLMEIILKCLSIKSIKSLCQKSESCSWKVVFWRQIVYYFQITFANLSIVPN